MTTTVHRVVHAGVLVDFGGARILTDPWLSERPGYRQGEPRSVASAADLPELAGIVISHGHYDHCDLPALAAYPDKTYAYTAGPVRDALLLKMERNRPDLYAQAVADHAPDTAVHVLPPGRPLTV